MNHALTLALALAAPSAPAQRPAASAAAYTLSAPLTTLAIAGPKWARNAVLYQAYPHDFWSPEYQKGSYFRRTQALLPTLREMGVGIIWMMPLHGRGIQKGATPPPGISKEAQLESDSPYSVRDYYSIEPRLGTSDELKRLIARAHELGLHVIMDWVPNHTSWGNALLGEHPDWYQKDAQGNIDFPHPWKDIAQLDYQNRAVWNYQRDALLHWLRDFNIDGFRMDAAGRVPIEFWNWLRPQLDAVKPVFMLAEADEPRHHPAFDATYAWRLPPVLWGIARRGVTEASNLFTARDIDVLLQSEAREYPAGAIRMLHLDNHDQHFSPGPMTYLGEAKNQSAGGIAMRYGPGYRAFAVLTATLPGKPMLYNSEENQEPDGPPASVPITPQALKSARNFEFYKRLFNLYKSSVALQNGEFIKVPSNHDEFIYSFVRREPMSGSQVLVVLNLSGQKQDATLQSEALAGDYRELFTDREARLGPRAAMRLGAWEYRVYVRS